MPRATRRRLVYASAAIGLGSILLITAIWWIAQERVAFEYRQSVTDIEDDGANLSLLMEARTESIMRDVVQTLRFVRSRYRLEGDALDLARMMRDVRIDDTAVKWIALVGPDGRVMQADAPGGSGLDVDPELLLRMKSAGVHSLEIGKTRAQDSGRALSMQVAIPILKPDGSTGGAVVAALDPAELVSVYAQTSLKQADLLLLVGSDGIVRIRRTGSHISSGEDLGQTDLMKGAHASRTGRFVSQGTRDHTVRYITFRVMPQFPLIVAAGTAQAAAFASFRAHRESYYTVAGLATAALVVLALVLMRVLHRQRLAVDALVRNEARFRATFDQAFVGMAQSAPDGALLQTNRTLSEITGYPQAELVDRKFSELVHPEDIGAPLSTGRPHEVRLLRKDGRVAWANVATTTVHDENGTDCLVTVVQDITEFKRIDRMKSEFVSIVSHELRTPLTSIRGSLGLIAGGVAGVLPDAAKNLVDIAKNNCERLIRLINDILDTEKIESGKMSFNVRELDLVELMTAAVEANEGFAGQHNVRLMLIPADGPIGVRADADRLTQLVTNLLSNAIKFSPPGADVEVALARRGARARVEVRDRGPGIPEQFRDRIFQKFSQADSSDTRQKGGTGLGLNISKAIIERLGGDIGFETKIGAGSTFYFELPAIPAAREGATATATSGRPRILVCEDDPDIARLIGMMLDKAGYDTDVAHTAAVARDMALHGRYDAITVDLKLPDEPGISLMRALRRTPQTRSLPVIVISAVADEGRLEINGEDLPVADWLQKPIDENRLARAVHRAVADTGEMWRVLHVEDDPDIQRVTAAVAQDFAAFELAGGLEEARTLLRRWRFDLVLLDLELPDGSGWDLLEDIRAAVPPPPVVIFSVHEVSAADRRRVAAVLLKSQTSNEQLLATIQRVLGPGRPHITRD